MVCITSGKFFTVAKISVNLIWKYITAYIWVPDKFVHNRDIFLLTPSSSPGVQFMSSEHADVYERGELDQDPGGDQDVDIRWEQVK